MLKSIALLVPLLIGLGLIANAPAPLRADNAIASNKPAPISRKACRQKAMDKYVRGLAFHLSGAHLLSH